jgi:type IV secretion system protein VirB6
MGFFAQFFDWLNAQLAAYVAGTAAKVAGALEPAAVTAATLYVMLWGTLHLRGLIEEPVLEGARRLLLLGVVLGMALRLWVYNELLVDTFFHAPGELVGAVIGAPTAVNSIDQIWIDGNEVAQSLLTQGGVLSGNISFYFAAVLVYLLIGLTCVYTAFLLALSLIAVAVLLAIGPLFIVLILFEPTKRFFSAWISQLANYAFIGVLVALLAALLLQVLNAFAATAVASGAGITIAETARLCLASALMFLIMRQVMPIASALAGGVALSSQAVVSRTLNRLILETRPRLEAATLGRIGAGLEDLAMWREQARSAVARTRQKRAHALVRRG